MIRSENSGMNFWIEIYMGRGSSGSKKFDSHRFHRYTQKESVASVRTCIEELLSYAE